MSVADLKAVIQSDINVSPSAQHLLFNNMLLNDDSRTLSQAGVGEGDMLGMHIQTQPQPLQQQRAAAQPSNPGNANQEAALARRQQMMPDPETVRLHMLGDPRVLEGVRRSNPQLAAVADNAQRFRAVLHTQQQAEVQAEAAKDAQIAMLNADPFNPDAQKEIEEIIRQNAVMENLQTAMEHTPEGESILLFESLWYLNMWITHISLQRSVVYQCFIYQPKSTVTRLKLSSTQGPRSQSCLLNALPLVILCA